MDAWLLGFFGFSAPATASASATASMGAKRVSEPVAELEHKRRHAPAQQQPLARRERIAHWDKKREKCQNCAHIYLKTLSRHPGFCSVDCKSNAAYLAKVNRTIRAVKDAVERQQQHESELQQPQLETEQLKLQQPSEVEAGEEEGDDYCEMPQAHTFADFGLEERVLDAANVQWAFSAVY